MCRLSTTAPLGRSLHHFNCLVSIPFPGFQEAAQCDVITVMLLDLLVGMGFKEFFQPLNLLNLRPRVRK
jgi:hypothetical protein